MILLRWILINIFLPITPIFLRYFIKYISREEISGNIKIIELPEMLFYSFILCIIALNINFDVKRRGMFDYIIRSIFFVIIALDLITLSTLYVGSAGDNVYFITFVLTFIPLVLSILYKSIFLYTNKSIKGKK